MGTIINEFSKLSIYIPEESRIDDSKKKSTQKEILTTGAVDRIKEALDSKLHEPLEVKGRLFPYSKGGLSPYRDGRKSSPPPHNIPIKEVVDRIKEVVDSTLKEPLEYKSGPFPYSDAQKSSPGKAPASRPLDKIWSKDKLEYLMSLPSDSNEKRSKSLEIIRAETNKASKELGVSLDLISILAEWVNHKNVILFDLGLSKADIYKIAPLLTHMNLFHNGFNEKEWTPNEIEDLIAGVANNLVSLSIHIFIHIKHLPKYFPKLETLDINLDLEELPTCPELRTLHIKNNQLKTLPQYPKLEVLDCTYCSKLTLLHFYPKLKNLTCIGCKNLEKLSEYPKLKELRCESCFELTAIPMQPELRFLNCNGCQGLTELPIFPKLETLYCCYCNNLSKLPEYPFLKSLHCLHCVKLTQLPSSPLLKSYTK